MSKEIDIVIIAGEESGDINASGVINSLQQQSSTLKFFGIGGRRLSDAGLEIIEHIDKMAVMGFAEVVLRYSFLKKTFNRMLKEVDKRKPARAILIDYPGFNLLFAKEMKKRNIPVTYYISPQLWAWKEKRISTIIDCVDQMICIFPFEVSWYKKRGVEAHFVGHPFMDETSPTLSQKSFMSKHDFSDENQTIALMPGSRQQEIKRHLPTLISTILKLMENHKINPIIGKAPGVTLPSSLPSEIKIERDNPNEALRYSKVGIVSSGTISLQAAFYQTPSVVIYKMNPISWKFTKTFSKVKYASMTNLIAREEILPELLQKDATSSKIAYHINQWLNMEGEYFNTKQKLATVKSKLGSPGCSERAAKLIIDKL